jgi:hypothetical protein
VSAVNRLVAFYDIHGRKGEVLFFSSVLDNTRDPKLITYIKPLMEVNPMSMSIHTSIFYLRPYIISHNSQRGYIIGTLKHKFGLKLQRRIGKMD